MSSFGESRTITFKSVRDLLGTRPLIAMLVRICLAACALAVLAAGDPVSFDYCPAMEATTIKFLGSDLSVDASPIPPNRGRKATITVAGTLSAPFTGGNYAIKVSLDGQALRTFSGDACKLFSEGCPVPAGPFSASSTLKIPSFTPGGKYTLQASIKSSQGVVACILIYFDMPWLEEAADLALVADNIPFSVCSPETSNVVDVSNLRIGASPSEIRPGTSLQLTIEGFLKRSITGGTFDVSVEYHEWNVLHEVGDICSLSTTSCPMPIGQVRLTKQIAVPKIAFSGDYTVTIKFIDASNVQRACLRLGMTLDEKKRVINRIDMPQPMVFIR